MITVDVYFVRDNNIGTACLVENLITNDIQLELSNKLFLHEIKKLINKAVKILEKRYEKVDVNIHWDTCEEEENVTTNK